MSSHGISMSAYPSLRLATFCSLFWGIVLSVGHSQESPAPPAPPTPHTGPVLPGTHTSPRPVLQKPGVVLHIDVPVSVNQKKCSEPQHTFNISYSVINNTTEPVNGIVRAVFNGVALNPVGSAKLQLPAGKKAGGTFVACCPSSGSFAARMDYQRDDTPIVPNKTSVSTYASDLVSISCR